MNRTRKDTLAAIACLAAILLVTFWKSLTPGMVLFTSDDSVGVLQDWKSTLPESWLAYWVPDNLVGMGGGQLLFNPTFLLLSVLPSNDFANCIFALDTFFAGFFFFLFLRRKQLSFMASLFGAILYSYCSCNFSLVYSGHIGKFGNYAFFAATLWALECWLSKPSAWSWFVAASAFLGLTVSEQPDLAILFVLLFIVYLGFRTLTREGVKLESSLVRWVGLVVLCGLISGLVAANVVISQYRSQVQGIMQVGDQEKEQAWNWATQWSFPPEETLALVAPGFFGWKNDDSQGPYWGRTGRSAEYETTKGGFPRFALSTTYFGIVPIFLACAMAVFVFRKRFKDAFEPALRRELIFWTAFAVICLLLAFGRYFLLYHFFYALPKMNIIRNPNKFLHIFSVAVAVLSAHGVHHLLERRTPALDTRRMWQILAGITGVAIVSALWIFSANESMVARFHDEFQKGSALIVSTMTDSLLRLAVTCGIFAVLWFWLERFKDARKLHAAIPTVVILLASTDLYLTNRHYVGYYEYKPMYAENDLVRFLKSDSEPQRAQLMTRASFYNLWLTVYFPYHRIQTIDIPQMPRMPEDYQNYLSTLQPNPVRFWQLTNCKYLLGPLQGWQQIQSDPLLKSHFDLAYVYNVGMSNNAIVTSPVTTQTQINANTQVVLRYNNALPRVKFYDS